MNEQDNFEEEIFNISFSLKQFKNKIELYYSILQKALSFFLYTSLFVLPLIILFYPLGIEINVFFFILISVVIILFTYLALIIINRKGFLIDPKGFVSVLTFSLLSSSAALLIKDSSASSTLGVTSVKGYAGLSIIVYIVIYYFINLYASSLNRFKKLAASFQSGLIILLFGSLFINLFSNYFIYSLLFGTMFLLIPTIKKKGFNYIKFLAILVGLYSILTSSLNNLNLLYVLVSFGVTLFVIGIIRLIKFRRRVIKTVSILKNRELNLKFIERNSIDVVTLIAFLLVTICILVLCINNKTLLDTFTDSFKIYSRTFDYLKVLGTSSVLIGQGGSALSSNSAFFNNLLFSQGLAGVTAYIVLLFFVVKFLVKEVILFKVQSFTNFILGFLLLFFIFTSIFIYPGLFVIISFWISLGFLTAKRSLDLKIKRPEISYEKNNKFLNISGTKLKIKIQTILLISSLISITLIPIVIYVLFLLKQKIY